MEKFDWYHRIKFLESVSNLKSVVEKSIGRRLNTERANGVVVCLRQGRMFFQSAKNAPLEIRPLITFYGMMGFAKGLILSKNLRKIENLKPSHGITDISLKTLELSEIDNLEPSHGITDISSENLKLHELKLKILTSGTFQEFNDVVCQTGKVVLLDNFYREDYFGAYYDRSEKLNDLQVSLKDILSRLLSLAPLYTDTFQEDSNILQIRLKDSEISGVKEFIVPSDSDKLNNNFESLRQFVTELRNKYSFLKDWCFLYANQSPHPMDSSFICINTAFSNIDKDGIDEFSGEFVDLDFFTYHYMHISGDRLIQKQNAKIIKLDSIKFNPNKINKLKISEISPPFLNIGTSTEPQFLVVQPIKNYYLSQYSLQYLGMFLLSSLVRYRPQIWVNAISKTPIGNSLVDDTALSLIEKFLDLILSEFPKMIVEEIKKPSGYMKS